MAWQNPNPYEGQNPYNTQGQQQPQQQQQPSQPSWGGAQSGGGSQGSIYNQYAPQTSSQPQTSGWPQASGGGGQQASWANDIAGAYQKYLGRSASQQEINDRLGQKNFNVGTHVSSIQNSAEAQQYAQRQQQQPPPGAQQTQPPQWRTDQPPPSNWQRYTPPNAPWTGGGVVPPGYGGMPPSQGTVRQAPQLPSDPRGWNTDNYPKPGWVAQQPARNPPPGWEASKWNDPNHQTPKYVIGRILSQYQPSKEGLAQAAQEIAQAYPGAQFNGKDKVTVPGLDTFDLLANSGSGRNMRWQLGAQGDRSAGARGGQAQPQAQTYEQMVQSLLQNYQGTNQPLYNYGGQQPPPGAESSEMAALRSQLAAYQQQQQTYQQQQQAAVEAQRNRGPQFNYF